MRKGLSAVKFIKNNKRTCAVLIIALALTFMAMYVVNFLLMSTVESFRTVMLEMPNKVSYVSFSNETLGIDSADYEDEEEYKEAQKAKRDEMSAKIKAMDGVDEVIFTQIIQVKYTAMVGMVGYEVPLLEAGQIQGFMDHIGAKLIDGRMPSGAGEILVDKMVYANQDYELGSSFNEEAYGETFKVVGVIESDYMFCVGTPNGYTNSGWYHVIYCNEETKDFRKLAEDIGIKLSKDDNVVGCREYQKFYNEKCKSTIDAAVNVILLVVMIFLAVSVIVAYVSFMRNRMNEYCLYASIGYSRKEIYGMIMREMLIIFGVGILIGIFFSLGLMEVFDQGAIAPRGLVSKRFYPGHLAKIGAALLCIVGVLQIPILLAIRSIRTIDMIED